VISRLRRAAQEEVVSGESQFQSQNPTSAFSDQSLAEIAQVVADVQQAIDQARAAMLEARERLADMEHVVEAASDVVRLFANWPGSSSFLAAVRSLAEALRALGVPVIDDQLSKGGL
jgi:uncharacterized coiled-coil protein SlyX